MAPHHRWKFFTAAACGTLWIAATVSPAAARPEGAYWAEAAHGPAGVHALRVMEGDGKKQSGAKDKDEAKRDAKSAGSKFKKGLKDMGSGIKNEFGEAKKDMKDPKHRKKRATPPKEGA